MRAAAVALARELERRHPDRITAQWWKEERGERVFVDFNQNAPHKTVFGAWCVRPRGRRPGVDADRVGRARRPSTPDELTIATVPARARRARQPVGGHVRPARRTSRPLLERSAHDLANGLMDAPWPPVYPKMPNEPPRVAPSRARTT